MKSVSDLVHTPWGAAILLALGALAITGECFGQQRPFDPFRNPPASPSESKADVIASVEFVDTPITTVFKMISDMKGWSVIMSPEVSKQPPRINIWIKNLTPDQVLDKIAPLAELVVERDGNTIKVFRFDEYARIYGLEKRTVQLKYAGAKDVAALLKPYAAKEDEARILADENGNKIILLVQKPLMDSFLKLIEAVDVPQTEDAIKVYVLKYAEASAVAAILDKFLTQRQQSPISAARVKTTSAPTEVGLDYQIRFTVVPKLNMILLRGHPKHIETAMKLIEQIDVPTNISIVGYQMKYTDASEVFKTLSDIAKETTDQQPGRLDTPPPRLHVAYSAQNNQIIVEGLPEDHKRIASYLEMIDKPMPVGTGGIRVYRLENATSSEVAKVVQSLIDNAGGKPQAVRGGLSVDKMGDERGMHPVGSLSGGSVAPGLAGALPPDGGGPSPGSAGGDVTAPRVTDAKEINAVIIKASAAQHEEFARLIKDLDKPRDQVLLEVTLVEVRSTKGFNLGLELGGAQIGSKGVQAIGFSSFGIGKVDPTTGAIRIGVPAPLGGNFGIFNADDFSVVLNALKSVGDARITSSPKILVQDNAQAQISQVNQEPYSITSQGQTSTLSSFGGFIDAGTTLTVIPHLSGQDWLRLEYQVDQSSFGTRTDPALPPPRGQNSITGIVRIPSDHMVVLGGLVSSNKQNTVDGIPFLSDIPGIGELFQNRSENVTNATLFVFIQPVIVRDPAFKDLLYMSQEDLKKAKLSSNDYPTNRLKMMVPMPLAGGGMP